MPLLRPGAPGYSAEKQCNLESRALHVPDFVVPLPSRCTQRRSSASWTPEHCFSFEYKGKAVARVIARQNHATLFREMVRLIIHVRSGDDVVDDFTRDVGQAVVTSVEAISQLGVFQTQQAE